MSRPSTHTRSGRGALALFCLVALSLTSLSLFIGLGTASGAGEPDSTTLGIGEDRSTVQGSQVFDAAAKLGLEDAAQGEDAQLLTQAVQRPVPSSIVQPVVELAAIDMGDSATIEAASKIGVLNPAKSTQLVMIDTEGEGWQVGEASGYDIESSSTLTRSGRSFDDDCVTVAVPEGMEELLGHPVVIVYDNMVVVATVTDTGGFAKYGRCLDLGGGVFKAFGFDDIWEWGVREVRYKFL